MRALIQNREATRELDTTARFPTDRLRPFHFVTHFPETLRRFLLRKAGATVVLAGLCFCLMVAAALGVPHADWGFAATVLVLLRKLLAAPAA
jgi:hypothetical protein